ncbi:hypothetical protein IHQ71_11610 [Rhizobium sp. TH2]|uniref:hypothetical protein n=1 Tax=Rhizobium sp. TH2 TaxID=2775403 RepID=UPI002157F2E1|nr:hypothetical protein [Rhizobium sp. TH2]UVC11160.1 hypothetical protein IHQ71_11610 [Rhizobium sp. TH2]
MKKFLLVSVAAIFAATSFAPAVAEAGHRGWKWRNGGHHHGWNHRGWRGNRYAYRHGRYYGRYHGRRYGRYWGPRVIVVAPGYYGGYNDGYYYDDQPRESGR